MEIHYQCNADDYVEAHRAHGQTMRRTILALGVLLTPGDMGDRDDGLAENCSRSGSGRVNSDVAIDVFSARLKRDFRKHPNLACEYLLRENDHGLEMLGNVSQGRGSWSSYTKFRETRDLFISWRADVLHDTQTGLYGS
jgi:hypothetical protein